MKINRLVCIDWKDSRETSIEGQWQKDWGTALSKVTVMTIDEFLSAALESVVLVFVHESAIRRVVRNDEQFLEELKKVRAKASVCNSFVGLVSAGKLCEKTIISDDSRYCLLSTPFPRYLGFLKDRIEQLISDLENAHCDSGKICDAWVRFDAADSFSDFTVALSVLCQGFLAQYALKNRIEGAGVDTKGYVELGNALKAIGWVEDEAAEQVSQTVVELDLDVGQPAPDIAFWTDPFEGSNSLRVGIQSELPKSLTQLPDIEKLINAIEQDTVNTEGFVDTVAKAYLELNKLLEAA
jgi:hypothetical protein